MANETTVYSAASPETASSWNKLPKRTGEATKGLIGAFIYNIYPLRGRKAFKIKHLSTAGERILNFRPEPRDCRVAPDQPHRKTTDLKLESPRDNSDPSEK